MTKKKQTFKTLQNQGAHQKYVHAMKTVTSHTCSVCKTPCKRGLAYLEKMQTPGAKGNGVPCILTKGRGFK